MRSSDWTQDHEQGYHRLHGRFLARYTHPAVYSTYDTKARGYHYPYGGPYRASDVLKARWNTLYATTFLEQVAVRICTEAGCYAWSQKPTLREKEPDDGRME